VFEAGGLGTVVQRVQEDSKQNTGAAVGEDLKKPIGVSPEEYQEARRGARKVMFKKHNTIKELLGEFDVMDDGIVKRDSLQERLQSEVEVDIDELNSLMTVADPGKRGFIAAVNFLDKLYDLSNETEADAVLRRIYQATRQMPDENVFDEIRQKDADNDGNVEKQELKEALKKLKCNISETDLEKIFGSYGKLI